VIGKRVGFGRVPSKIMTGASTYVYSYFVHIVQSHQQ
jgi:hypothetical protein